MKSLNETLIDEVHKIDDKKETEGFVSQFMQVKDNFTEEQIKALDKVFNTLIEGIQDWISTEYSPVLEEWIKKELISNIKLKVEE